MKQNLLDKFEQWYKELSNHDRDNFNALIRLPNSTELIAKLPDGEYKQMSIIALALMGLQNGKIIP